MTEHPAYAYLQAVFRCRELGAALARYATAGTLANVKRSLATGHPVTVRGSSMHDGVSHGAAEVAKLVLQDLENPEHQFSCQPTEEGLHAVQALQEAIFGAGSTQRSLPQCVFLATLAQAVQTLDLITAALLDALAPSNCLSLLNAATACGCGVLRRRARALALAHFSAAAQLDANGLMCMEEATLLSLLCSDRLQAGSELEVFRALAAWTERDRAARQPGLAVRIARCVRLATLSLPDIYALGDHPLVVSDRASSQLVAQVVIHMMMGAAVECPLGMPTISRPRRCAPAAQPAPGADHGCGVEEHAGRHDSVFAAAACAFARQRSEHAAAAADAAANGLRHLSVSPASDNGSAAAEPEAPGSAQCVAPCSPLAAEAPTPTGASHAAAAAPAVQPTARVRHIGLGKRVTSRRTLFGASGGCSDSVAMGSKAAADGDKEPAAAAPAAVALQAAAAGGAASGSASLSIVGSVTLEMAMSPNRASVRALAQAAAAASLPPAVGGWESRKRLRFD